MSALQVTGILVGVATGLIGTALGVINLIWRWWDTQPRLSVEANVAPISTTETQAALVVRNTGHVAVTVKRVDLDIRHPTDGSIEFNIPEIYRRPCPFRLEPGALEQFAAALRIVSARLGQMGLKERHFGVFVLVDGLNNRYESDSFPIEPAR